METVRVVRSYVEGRFGQIHLRIARPSASPPTGEPPCPPLICLHMSPNSGRIYQQFLAAMGTRRLTVAPDTPGFGESDAPPRPPSIEDYAAAMGDLIDALGFAEADVMGYHTGAETCTALALARPRQIRRLVLISAPIFTAEELGDFRAHYAHEPLSTDGEHLVKKWRANLYWAGPGRTMEMVAEHFADSLRNPTISWWGHHAAFAYDMAGELAKVRQPVLVLNPDDDLHTQTLRAEGKLQNGRIMHLPGWGHGFLDLHTEEARDIVSGFLEAPRSRAP